MSKASTPTQRQETRQIEKSQWIEFLSAFTHENSGAHARLEVVGPDVGYQVETGDRPFEEATADIRGNQSTVWINLGTSPADHLTHGIQGVTLIRALPAAGERGAVLEVESKDGLKTILELSSPQTYALPPSEQGEEDRDSSRD